MRKEFWQLLASLKLLSPMPWLCVGDFNEIVEQAEKRGAASRSIGQMDLFKQTLEDCQLCDLGFKGSKLHGVTNKPITLSQKNDLIEL